jgi:3-deoxy-7-phosphoheptulonate synthase
VSARAPHDFLGIDVNGMTMQVTTTGNDSAHVILRGTKQGPNYHAEHVAEAARLLSEKGIAASVVVDASHDNSSQNPDNQLSVIKDLSQQVAKGSRAVRGVLIESNINHGKQKHDVHNPGPLEYGVSITDGCVDLGETVEMFDMLSAGVRQRRRMAA